MRYALLLHYPQPAVPTVRPEEIEAGKAAFHAYAKALDDAGVLRSAEVLQQVAKATSLSLKQGTPQVQDGPFAETKELLGGFFLLECESHERAVEVAARVPEAELGLVEVRPVLGLGGTEL